MAITTLTIVIFGQANQIKSRVLGDNSTLISPLDGIESIPSDTLTPSPTPLVASPTPSPSPTPTSSPTQAPTPMVKPQPVFTSEQIYGFTNYYGILYAVDPNIIRHVAICESGFNPSAKYLKYAGLFQFDTLTWQTYRVKMGLDADPDLRYHAEEAVRTATYIFSLGKTSLWPNCYPK